jgi:hypothetical protein
MSGTGLNRNTSFASDRDIVFRVVEDYSNDIEPIILKVQGGINQIRNRLQI